MELTSVHFKITRYHLKPRTSSFHRFGVICSFAGLCKCPAYGSLMSSIAMVNRLANLGIASLTRWISHQRTQMPAVIKSRASKHSSRIYLAPPPRLSMVRPTRRLILKTAFTLQAFRPVRAVLKGTRCPTILAALSE